MDVRSLQGGRHAPGESRIGEAHPGKTRTIRPVPSRLSVHNPYCEESQLPHALPAYDLCLPHSYTQNC
jgi:hypothetical protein